jgi:hypothetical protein
VWGLLDALQRVGVGYVAWSARTALGVMFVLSAVSKSRSAVSFREFRDGMVALAPWTARVATSCAVAVLVCEWVTVVLLTVPGWPESVAAGGFVVAMALLGTFSMVLVAALRRGVVVGCRCFGSAARPVDGVQVLRNVVAVAVAMAGLVSLVVGGGASLGREGTAIAVVAGLVVGVLLVALDDVVHLFVDDAIGTPLLRG